MTRVFSRWRLRFAARLAITAMTSLDRPPNRLHRVASWVSVLLSIPGDVQLQPLEEDFPSRYGAVPESAEGCRSQCRYGPVETPSSRRSRPACEPMFALGSRGSLRPPR